MIWLGVENTQWTQAAADRLFRLRTPYHVDGGPWNVPSRWCRRRPSSDGSGAGDGPSDGGAHSPPSFPLPSHLAVLRRPGSGARRTTQMVPSYNGQYA